MSVYTIELSTEEEKALLTDMLSVQDWLDNAIHEKARRCMDEVCGQALRDKAGTILTTEEKQAIVAELANEGSIISTVKEMPEAIKRQIVSMARVKSAAEKNAEFEAVVK
jgi:polyhydroxyalkanoate synthesis regulator phasin